MEPPPAAVMPVWAFEPPGQWRRAGRGAVGRGRRRPHARGLGAGATGRLPRCGCRAARAATWGGARRAGAGLNAVLAAVPAYPSGLKPGELPPPTLPGGRKRRCPLLSGGAADPTRRPGAPAGQFGGRAWDGPRRVARSQRKIRARLGGPGGDRTHDPKIKNHQISSKSGWMQALDWHLQLWTTGRLSYCKRQLVSKIGA
jgi:hypothetical protein